MRTNRPINVDDTSNCPRRENCETCGGTHDVATVTTGSMLGIGCLAICIDCESSRDVAMFAVGREAERVLEHCEHLGIDLDQMADALRAERNR